MPVAASPAPMNRIFWSASLPPVTRSAEKMPASATAAVPWMSSLNVQMRSRYRSSSRKAFWLAKSSNCTTTPGNTACVAVMNSSTSSSYAAPRTRFCFRPMYSGSASSVSLLVPTSSMIGRHWFGWTPAQAV